MRSKKKYQNIAAIIGLAVTGWFVGRSLGPSERTAPEPVAVDPHVTIRDPALDQRAVAAAQISQRRPELATAVPRPHPRAEGEWQGMLVDMSMRQTCDVSQRCGLGLSCRSDGLCGPCEIDSDCASGEACVLDHCLPADNVECTAAADCIRLGPEAVCALSGLTGGEPRGNSKMRAYCLKGTGGESPSPETAKPRLAGHAQPPPFDRRDLLQDLRSEALR